MNELITFKSSGEFFKKEKSGLKNNTIRYFDFDSRFDCLDNFISDNGSKLFIRIINVETNESFIRKIKDVSFYTDNNFTNHNDGIYIITWDIDEYNEEETQFYNEIFPY